MRPRNFYLGLLNITICSPKTGILTFSSRISGMAIWIAADSPSAPYWSPCVIAILCTLPSAFRYSSNPVWSACPEKALDISKYLSVSEVVFFRLFPNWTTGESSGAHPTLMKVISSSSANASMSFFERELVPKPEGVTMTS